MTTQQVLSAFPWYLWLGLAGLALTIVLSVVWLICDAARPDLAGPWLSRSVVLMAALSGILIGVGLWTVDRRAVGYRAAETIEEATKTPDARWVYQQVQPILLMGCQWGCAAWRLLSLDRRSCHVICRPLRRQSWLGWLLRKLRRRFRR